MSAIEEQISQRAELIKAKTTSMNRVEDEVFAKFCAQIGVANIRQYEEKELRAQQERAKKRLAFENQKSRLMNQLEYERSRDTEGRLWNTYDNTRLGGPQRPPTTNFAAQAKPPRFQPRRFMTVFFEVLRIFWHQVCENRTSRYVVTWPFVTRCQPEKWDLFSYCVQSKWQSEFFHFGL